MTDINWLERAEQADFSINNVINGETISTLPDKDDGQNIIEKYSPRDGRLLYCLSEGSASDVDKAVAAAREACNDGRWSQLSITQRASILNRFAELLEQNHDKLVLNECLDVGKTITTSLRGEIARATTCLREAAKMGPQIKSVAATDLGEMGYQRIKPVGVVGAIVGWNYPIVSAARKVAAALIMGNSLVLKPSEFTCLSTQYLGILALEAGVPPGVLNIVHGAGAIVGDAMARHIDIDLISFVGSSATGRHVMAAAGESNMKRVIMECGGKSAYIVFDDCPEDLDFIAQDIVDTSFPNQGALCVASSRLVIHNSLRERLLPLVIEKAAALIPSDPLDPKTNFGALVNEGHMNKVLGYIETAKREGAELLLGGERVYPEGDEALKTGFYVPPTIFDKVSPDDTIAQEEIFGPVLAVIGFDTEEEAIAIANNSQFGLSGYAVTTDLCRAQRLGAQANTGTLVILGTTSPSGGAAALSADKHKQSGMGFSGGVEGFEAYANTTTVYLLS